MGDDEEEEEAEDDENEEDEDLDSTTLASVDDDDEEDTLGLLLDLAGGAKAMKAMKKKKAMKKLKSFTQKRYAFAGKLAKTASGLTKADLVKNKHGKVVSKKKSAFGLKSP